MVRTVEHEPLQKHTLSFYQGDFEKLGAFYPDLGPSVAVRRIIRAHLKKLEAGLSPLPQIDMKENAL